MLRTFAMSIGITLSMSLDSRVDQTPAETWLIRENATPIVSRNFIFWMHFSVNVTRVREEISEKIAAEA